MNCANPARLILYFPVSALVTLFANILQNPQDPRARSDVHLMNQVVNFLSLLAVTEEQGGVKRMLGVCSEFERIAKVVLDKAEKESHSRRKRKNTKGPEELVFSAQQVPQKRTAPLTPQSNSQPSPATTFAPSFANDVSGQQFNPSLDGFTPGLSNGDMAAPLDWSSLLNPPSNAPAMIPENDLQQQFANENLPSINLGSFQQPFVPQDLWQMPMTLEWDWADMSNVEFPQFEAGSGGQQQQQQR